MAEVTAPEMERIFKRFAAVGEGGKISSAELGEAIRILGSTPCDEIRRMITEIDTDGDGYIDFKEFAAFCRANPALMNDVAKVF
ncbi:polcalcin Phl p 7-like [Canna indica]|uniref:Polcalcin Phl p 7-like n=1 Tax=Canna indica TaxID=4628 RepID=A0AAQ3Q6K8_9LILI|nr:polcalcin Phl p 7-like [Canna indica]